MSYSLHRPRRPAACEPTRMNRRPFPSRGSSAFAITALLAPVFLSGLVTAADHASPSVGTDLPSATRGPVNVAFTPNGKWALVAESDNDTLAVLDAVTGSLVRRMPAHGDQPSAVACDGEVSALVTNVFSGSVTRMDLVTGRLLAVQNLPGGPTDVVIAAGEKQAFVSLSQLNEIAVLDLPSLAVKSRIPVGQRPRALALTPDGKTLLAANFQGGSVSMIDTTILKERTRVPLRGVNLRGLTVSADGKSAWVTGQVPIETRVTWMANDVWVNTVFRIDLTDPAAPTASDGRLDFVKQPAPDPDGIAALPDGRIALAASGSDEALLIRSPLSDNAYMTPAVAQRTTVGAHPRGIALAPGGKQLWVASELGNSLSILDATTLKLVRRIELDAPAKPDPSLPGRYLFANNGMTAGGQFTCNSCHPQGGSDGLAWEFVHVPDELTARNTRFLRGAVTRTAPFRWSGREREVELFLQDEISGLMHGKEQPAERLHALRIALERMPLPANPYRTVDGAVTPSALRGQALFEGKAGCVSCHSGSERGGAGLAGEVGTSGGRTLDVPHLRGVYDSAPYLHDARAKSLEEVFGRWNKQGKHGKAHILAPEELTDLLRYLREL